MSRPTAGRALPRSVNSDRPPSSGWIISYLDRIFVGLRSLQHALKLPQRIRSKRSQVLAWFAVLVDQVDGGGSLVGCGLQKGRSEDQPFRPDTGSPSSQQSPKMRKWLLSNSTRTTTPSVTVKCSTRWNVPPNRNTPSAV